jgi:superoxide dismutase
MVILYLYYFICLKIFFVGIALVQCIPIIGIDLWEHAYFDRFHGDKEAYVEQYWNFINWGKVSENFEKYNLNQNKVAPLLE